MEPVYETFSVLKGSLTISFCPFLEVYQGNLFLEVFRLREETFPVSTIHWGNCLSLGALGLMSLVWLFRFWPNSISINDE